MTKHVVNLTLAKKLKESGYPQDLDIWTPYYGKGVGAKPETRDFTSEVKIPHFKAQVKQMLDRNQSYVRAPLSTELLERLPDVSIEHYEDYKFEVWFKKDKTDIDYRIINSKSLPDALAECWLWLKENGHV